MAFDSTVTPRTGWRAWRDRLLLQEDLNFLLTNRVPRIALTHAMGWFSRIRSPLLARCSIALWRLVSDLDLSESRQQRFASLHDCFTRELRPGARPFVADEALLCSPCDGIVGASGPVQGELLLQAKGMPYALAELLGSAEDAQRYDGGCYATLRLTSAMYHRFHAPRAGRIDRVRYFSGDTWNVNPIALARIERLFCRNERAVIRLQGQRDELPLLLVPVAAILVASIRLHAPPVHLHLRYRGANVIDCDVAVERGQELGWFEHGSTIIVIAPRGHRLADGLGPGSRVRAGQALMQR